MAICRERERWFFCVPRITQPCAEHRIFVAAVMFSHCCLKCWKWRGVWDVENLSRAYQTSRSLHKLLHRHAHRSMPRSCAPLLCATSSTSGIPARLTDRSRYRSVGSSASSRIKLHFFQCRHSWGQGDPATGGQSDSLRVTGPVCVRGGMQERGCS